MGTKFSALFVALLSACTAAEASTTSTTQGRFQLVQLGTMRADQYLLDTLTGRIWTPVSACAPGEQCLPKFVEVRVGP